MIEAISEVQEYLERVRIPVRLSCLTTGGWPALISLWYLSQDDFLYCATQESAKIVRYIENDNRCAFEIAADDPPYCGVRGQARAWVDDQLGAEMLERLLVRYLGDTENDLAKNLLAKKDTEVAIVIEPMRIYTWDFRQRMKGIGDGQSSRKVCP
jgi:nitroimidazol reductase NimA-like FMN-containing flavoprotein (pyridoxamine 5'-phosphate oxidase superfamily)